MDLKALFIDIDGTLVIGQTPAQCHFCNRGGREMGLSLQFLTNVTRRMPAVIAAQLRAEGFDIRR